MQKAIDAAYKAVLRQLEQNGIEDLGQLITQLSVNDSTFGISYGESEIRAIYWYLKEQHRLDTIDGKLVLVPIPLAA